MYSNMANPSDPIQSDPVRADLILYNFYLLDILNIYCTYYSIVNKYRNQIK